MTDNKRSKLATITRRTLLISSVAIAGGVAFGYWKFKQPYDNPLEKNLGDNEAAITPYILINRDGISIVVPRGEMGQGVQTTLAAMVAEELDVTLSEIKVIHGPASSAYFNFASIEENLPFSAIDNSWLANTARDVAIVPAKFLGLQATGGSSSVADAFDKMRTAGAAAREVLVKAAAQQLEVSVASLSTNNGNVIDQNGTSIPYSELALIAAGIEPSSNPPLKPKSQWRILGKSQARVDVIAKSTGTAEYGIDVELPNMLFASIKVNPHLQAGMNSFDASKALTMPGVKKVFAVDNGVAVIATNTWYAFQAVNTIEFDWQSATYPNDTQGHINAIKNSFNDDLLDSQRRNDGNVEKALSNAAEQVIKGEYLVPYLAHAPIEPMNATAWVRDGKIDIWVGNQLPTQIVKNAIAITGFSEDKVNVHTMLMGGSFGRRFGNDYINQAIKIAQEMTGTPVKLTWTREEDTTHDRYRPMAMARFTAAIDDNGPTAVDLEIAATSIAESFNADIGLPSPGPDAGIVQGAWDQPYIIPNYRVTGYRTPSALPVGYWRSVGASHNGFFHECMIDEIAHAKGLDPLQMRLDLIEHAPSRGVLEAVAELSNWPSELPKGQGRGIAFSMSFGVPVAQVIDVAIQNNKVKVINAYAAVDVGTALDPRNIEAQVSGGLIFGLSAAMTGEITIEDGKIQQTNFHAYTTMRIHETPEIKVKILENGDKIRGIGEPGVPPAAPALANAIFAATGQRIRTLPLNKSIGFA